jgi:hypothetical protein
VISSKSPAISHISINFASRFFAKIFPDSVPSFHPCFGFDGFYCSGKFWRPAARSESPAVWHRQKSKLMRIKAIIAAVALSGIASFAADDVDISKLPPPAAKKDITFEKDIKPIFEKACFKCPGEEKPKVKLRVNTLEGVKKGSENGPVVIAGKSEKSLLVHTVAGLVEDMLMPPEGKADPLTRDQIALIRAWIDQGVK